MSAVRVADIEHAVAERFPIERAEDWDRCGLLVGDPLAEVTGVALALDPTLAAIDATVDSGANVLVTHHPAFLSPPQNVGPGRGAGGVVFAAVSRGVSLINAHTNLDRDEEAQSLTPRALGLTTIGPVETSLELMSVVTVFAPESSSIAIIDAMAAAGAGRVGQYRRAAFASAGAGTFEAPATSTPAVGEAGARNSVPESRIEMVCSQSGRARVVAAAITAHPYEEPLILVEDALIARNAARMGMLCHADTGLTLRALAQRTAAAYQVRPRVWGEPDARLVTIATATGSAGSLIGDAIAAGAEALVAGEVRYHDAMDAVAAGLAVIEIGHDVSEWPLVELLESAVKSVPNLKSSSVRRLNAQRLWWNPDEERGSQ